jgi:peptidylprolyl isomerase
MKHTALILLLAAGTVAASAQTPAKPAAPAAKPATVSAKSATLSAKPTVPTAKPAAAATPSPTVAAIIKVPTNKCGKDGQEFCVPQHPGPQKPLFTVALRYQDIKVGTGAEAAPGKLYKVLYTGWRAADGIKFDSTDDHPRPPVLDKDGKPVMGDDGKPKQGPPQPIPFPQGSGGTITGFDQGFVGMRVGGKRLIFIPWQLGYGTRALPPQPGHETEHPGIPAKSDLIFDVELVDVTDMPPPQPRPSMMRPPQGGQPMPPRPGGAPNGAAGQPGNPSQGRIFARPVSPDAPAAPQTPGTAPKPPVAVAPPPAPPAPQAAPAPAPAAPAPPQAKQ